MTPGQEALAEAARLETARVYGETLEQFRGRYGVHIPAVDADDIDAAIDKRRAERRAARRARQAGAA